MLTVQESEIMYAPGTPVSKYVDWIDPTSKQQFKWDKFPVPYLISPSVPPFASKAFLQALDAWKAVLPKTFSFVKSKPVVPTDYNPAIVLYWEPKGWLGGENALAITGPTTLAGTGSLVKSFIHINAGNFGWHNGDPWWVSAKGKTKAQADVYRVILHELGHCLGLWHSDDPTSCMYAYLHDTPSAQYITPDDVAGINSIYK